LGKRSKQALSETEEENLQLFAVAEDTLSVDRARTLAQQFDIPFLKRFPTDRDAQCLLLIVSIDGCRLQLTGRKVPGPVLADFTSGAVDHRRKFGGGKGQMIAKAVGIKGASRPRIADVTAGLGRDSFVLATLGCEVQMVERSPIIHCLLQSGLERAELNLEVAEITERMHLVHQDSIQWLRSLTEEERPDVVYVDPMFPHNEKSALVKKEMRVFRSVVGDDMDSEALLRAALDVAIYRVVVKRSRKAPLISGPSLEGVEPSYQLEGKSSRYDIYTLKKMV